MGIENGVLGIENGVMGIENGVMGIENGVMGIENGVMRSTFGGSCAPILFLRFLFNLRHCSASPLVGGAGVVLFDNFILTNDSFLTYRYI